MFYFHDFIANVLPRKHIYSIWQSKITIGIFTFKHQETWTLIYFFPRDMIDDGKHPLTEAETFHKQ